MVLDLMFIREKILWLSEKKLMVVRKNLMVVRKKILWLSEKNLMVVRKNSYGCPEKILWYGYPLLHHPLHLHQDLRLRW